MPGVDLRLRGTQETFLETRPQAEVLAQRAAGDVGRFRKCYPGLGASDGDLFVC
jgi:hypothetical protein